jgi:hypothetical protein
LHWLSAFTPSMSRLVQVLLSSSNFCLHFLPGRSKSCVRHSIEHMGCSYLVWHSVDHRGAPSTEYACSNNATWSPRDHSSGHPSWLSMPPIGWSSTPVSKPSCSCDQRSSVCCHLHWRFQWRHWESPQIKLAWRGITGARL